MEKKIQDLKSELHGFGVHVAQFAPGAVGQQTGSCTESGSGCVGNSNDAAPSGCSIVVS